MTKPKLVGILEKILPAAEPAEIMVMIEDVQELLLRDNSLALGADSHKVLARLRVEQQGRVAEELTNAINLPGLRQALARAKGRAVVGRPGPLLLSPGGIEGHSLLDRKPELPKPQAQADLLAPIADLASKTNLAVNARLTAKSVQIAVVNTAGLAVGSRDFWSEIWLDTASSNGLGRGFGYSRHQDPERLDAMAAFLAAAAKCEASDRQNAIAPGEYTVILEPAAVADLLGAAAFIFGGKAFAKKQTPLTRIGERLFSDQLNIWEGIDSPAAIDYEGTVKKRIELVRAGAVQAICHDHETARAYGTATTGHASRPGCPWGPLPGYLAIEPGNAMLDDMIASTKKGVLVSRLLCLTTLDPRTAMVTGTTGGGTLLVEDGKLSFALPNLRFVHSLTLALRSIEMIGDEVKSFGGPWHGCSAPALKLSSFTFLPGSTGPV